MMLPVWKVIRDVKREGTVITVSFLARKPVILYSKTTPEGQQMHDADVLRMSKARAILNTQGVLCLSERMISFRRISLPASDSLEEIIATYDTKHDIQLEEEGYL